ncbi:MAG TPA: hypothetical protein VGM90_18070 [Kofleriaceae bacterium]|jgi:hypothetical protein
MNATTVSFPYFDLVMTNGATVVRASGTNVLPLPALHPRVRDEVVLLPSEVVGLSSGPDPSSSRLHNRERCLRWFYDCTEPTESERTFLDRLIELAVKSCV